MADDKWCELCDHMWQLDYDYCPHDGTELRPASAREEDDEDEEEVPGPDDDEDDSDRVGNEEEITDSGVEH